MDNQVKYPIRFDAEAYLAGACTDFIPANASLDGDWACEHLGVPFEEYYKSLEVQ